jgi:hypothetical protein
MRFSTLIVSLFLAATYSYAETARPIQEPAKPAAKPRRRTPPPLAPVVEIQSNLPTADAAIGDFYFSEAFGSNPRNDLTGIRMAANERFLARTDIPNENKVLIIKTFGISDPRVLAVLKRAKVLEIRQAILITDANNFKNLTGAEKMSADFVNLPDRDTPQAKAMNELIDAGFKFNDPRFGIFSQPVYNDEKVAIKPINHEKNDIRAAVDKNGNVTFPDTATQSTANLNSDQRVNRMFFIKDQDLQRAMYEQSKREIKGFGEGLEISKIEQSPRTKVIYKDVTWIELAYTDGRSNPNDRIATHLRDLSVKHHEQGFNEFVMTHNDVIEAQRALMKAQPEAKLFVCADQQFASTNGPGRVAAMGGFFVDKEFGDDSFPFSQDAQKRSEIFIYQRRADGSTGPINPEGEPTFAYLNHDKTFYDQYSNSSGQKRVRLATGSFNLSGAIANAESQFFMDLQSTSSFANHTIDSIKSLPKTQPQYAIPVIEAVWRDRMARITDHTIYDIPLESAKKVVEALRSGDVPTFIEEVTKVAELPSTRAFTLEMEMAARSSGKSGPELVKERIKKLGRFLTWYDAKFNGERNGIFPQRAESVARAIITGVPTSYRRTLEVILWKQDQTKESLEKAVQEAYREITGSDKPLPSRKIVSIADRAKILDQRIGELRTTQNRVELEEKIGSLPPEARERFLEKIVNVRLMREAGNGKAIKP